MLTPNRLFFVRLKQHVRYIAKSLRSVLDWTVWLYVLVPLLFIASGLYIELWTRIPAWANDIPWSLMLITAVSFLLLNAKPHIGVEEADQLILLQHKQWLQRVKQLGLVYSVIMAALRLLILYAVLLPYLMIVAELSKAVLLELLLYSICTSLIMLIVNQYLIKEGKWWMRLIRSGVRSIVLAVVWVLPAFGYTVQLWPLHYFIIASAVIAIVLAWRYAVTPLAYARQLRQEQEFRLRLTSVLLSQVHETKSSKRRKRPWIFRKSQRLFKRSDAHYVISELRIKAILRSPSLLQIWGLMIVVGSYAITLVDGVGVWVIVAGLVFIKRSWLHMQWEHWRTEDYLQLYLTEAYAAKKLSQRLLMGPGLAIWTIIALL